MAKFTKSVGGGSWVDKKVLRVGDIAKIVSEAQEQDNNQGGKQIVAKLRIKGDDGEAKNVAINTPTKNALIEAFGDESASWMNKLLTVHVEKTIIAGKRGIALYLVPEGYEVTEDAGGYVVIALKVTATPRPEPKYDVAEADDIASSIPF